MTTKSEITVPMNRNIDVSANRSAVSKYKHPLSPDESVAACGETSANQKAQIYISSVNNRKGAKTVGAITECEFSESFKFPSKSTLMVLSLKKLDELLLRYPKIIRSSSSWEVNTNLKARSLEQKWLKMNTIVSVPSNLKGEIYPTAYPGNVMMSVITRGTARVKKSECVQEFISLKLVEANY